MSESIDTKEVCVKAWNWYRGRATWVQAVLALAAAAALAGLTIGMWALVVAMTSRALPA